MAVSSVKVLGQFQPLPPRDYQRLLCTTASFLLHDRGADILCKNIFETLGEAFQLDSYAYYLTSSDGTVLNLASAGGSEETRTARRMRLDFGEAVCGSVAQSGETAYLPRIQERDDEATLYLRYPLMIKGSPIGTLSFGSNRRDWFYPEELALMQIVAQQVNIATERRLQQDYLNRIEQLAGAGRMCATLAHEINNPLASIVNLLYLLRDEVATGDGKAFLQKAEVQVTRLTETARRMLDQFRGKQQLPSRVDLSELAQDLAANISLPHQVRLLTHYTGGGHVHALPGELRQVLFNLLLNAAQFTPPGGDVTLTVRRSGRFAQVLVRDQGPGISEKSRVHLFRPFYTASREGGTGIGLWISREMIERVGGSLTFVSHSVASAAIDPAIAAGTEFIITLPLLDDGLETGVDRTVPSASSLEQETAALCFKIVAPGTLRKASELAGLDERLGRVS